MLVVKFCHLNDYLHRKGRYLFLTPEYGEYEARLQKLPIVSMQL